MKRSRQPLMANNQRQSLTDDNVAVHRLVAPTGNDAELDTPVWQGECRKCTWRGPWRTTSNEALQDGANHPARQQHGDLTTPSGHWEGSYSAVPIRRPKPPRNGTA